MHLCFFFFLSREAPSRRRIEGLVAQGVRSLSLSLAGFLCARQKALPAVCVWGGVGLPLLHGRLRGL